MSLKEFKDTYDFYVNEKVEWGDMDSFQHVNNTVYFSYFERVRIAFFNEHGLLTSMKNDGKGPILASTNCRFRTALEYPDSFYIGTNITDLEEDRFLMKYAIYSEKNNCIAAEGEGFIIYFDYIDNVKAKIPGDLYLHMQEASC